MQRRIIDGSAAVGVRAHCEEERQINTGLPVCLPLRSTREEVWV
jgi:hypothetical protein